VIVGPAGSRDTIDMLGALNTRFIPNHVAIYRPSDQKSPDIDKIVGFVKNYVTVKGKATAYVCLDNACKAPTTHIKEMLVSLKEAE
jgi:hypothetical protein